MSAVIKMDHLAGTGIERACEDACRVANMLGVGVEFAFNGVRCLAWPQGSSDDLADKWEKELGRKLKSPHDSRFCVTSPETAAVFLREKQRRLPDQHIAKLDEANFADGWNAALKAHKEMRDGPG